ncbi:hypothetical protein AAEP93_011508 [Penicillium crustosum]
MGTPKTFDSVSSSKRPAQDSIGESWIDVGIGLVCADDILVLDPFSICVVFWASQWSFIDTYIPSGLDPCLPGPSENNAVKLGHWKSSSDGVTSVPVLESLLCDSSLELGPESDAAVGLGTRLGTLRTLCALAAGVGFGTLPALHRVGRSTTSASPLRAFTTAPTAAGRVVFLLAGRPSGCEIE